VFAACNKTMGLFFHASWLLVLRRASPAQPVVGRVGTGVRRAPEFRSGASASSLTSSATGPALGRPPSDYSRNVDRSTAAAGGSERRCTTGQEPSCLTVPASGITPTGPRSTFRRESRGPRADARQHAAVCDDLPTSIGQLIDLTSCGQSVSIARLDPPRCLHRRDQ
jgi:hypothetical protein